MRWIMFLLVWLLFSAGDASIILSDVSLFIVSFMFVEFIA
jgi:hypothetical protein